MAYVLFFRRYAPFASFGGGFEGDHRTVASTSLSESARTIGAIAFGPGFVGTITGTSCGTTYVGLGPTIAKTLGRHYSKVMSSVSVKTSTLSAVSFIAETAGANPMIPGAPDIDTFVDFNVVFRSSVVEFSGTVRGDSFPNAEVFVRDSAGSSVLLLDFETSGGQQTGPLTRLAGNHESQMLGNFSYRVGIDSSGLLAPATLAGSSFSF